MNTFWRHSLHIPLLLLWMGVLGSACSTADRFDSSANVIPPNALYITGVPFFSQLEQQCGPASLAAVLNYWGKSVSPNEIATAIYSPRLNGTLSLDMWLYAKNQEFHAEMHKGSISDLETHLAQNIPVIAFLNLGYDWMPVGHFVVVVGLDRMKQTIITYNGNKQNSRISYDQFLQDWGKTNFWTLVVQPQKEV